MSGESRSSARLRAHYEVEKQLADRLKTAPPAERRRLYSEVYDELFRRVPDHPQRTRVADTALRQRLVNEQLALLKPFLGPAKTYMEIGAGDCALAFAVAPRVQHVIAIEVSAEIAAAKKLPSNFELILSDGIFVPVKPASVHVAYSNQLMEHLHPDDALAELSNIFRALAPGGCYVCVTPNRLSGPHDISQYFNDQPQGFHLKEYTVGELAELFGTAGFSHCAVINGARRFFWRSPVWCLALLEMIASTLSLSLRRSNLFRAALGIRLIGYKSG
jgi:SAM-dependent methyltransferase